MPIKNRAATEQFILNQLASLKAPKENLDIYRELFKGMDDAAFDQFMADLSNGTRFLPIYRHAFAKDGISVSNNIQVAKRLGHDFYQRVMIPKRGEVPAHLTPVKYLVVDLPLRRASQLLLKKISIPDHNRAKDLLTGQMTGDSKGSKISYPELQVLASMGMDASVTEMIKYRGGDNKGFRAMNAMIARYGTANLKVLANYAGGVDSTKLLKTYLSCMMLSTTL